MIDFKKLSEPFKQDELDWRLLQAGVKDGRPWGFCAPYVDARAIMNRLDSVCGPALWQSKFHSLEKGFLCDLSLKPYDEWITKVDGSDETDTEPFKGGISKALVRAAVSWNIGRYLYDLPQQFADFNEVNKATPGARYAKIDEKIFYWLPPHKLPAWALPESDKKITSEPEKQNPGPAAAGPSTIPTAIIGGPISPVASGAPGDVIVPFGHHQGRRLKTLSEQDVVGIADFYARITDPKGKAKTFKVQFEAYLKTRTKK